MFGFVNFNGSVEFEVDFFAGSNSFVSFVFLFAVYYLPKALVSFALFSHFLHSMLWL